MNEKEILKKIIAKIQILDYLPNVLYSQIDGEIDEWNDASKIKILEPLISNPIINIYHNIPQEEKSFWRCKGLVMIIKIPHKFLFSFENSSIQIFSDAIEIIKI